jgi:ring-1,2-phenylacetyl-CoA epoxidase subunit PaaC
MLTSTVHANKVDYLLHLADNALILSQRQSEWCGHGPILEQDIAITNISLDLLGQARNWYQYVANILNEEHIDAEKKETEDSLAYIRTERAFKNITLMELPNGDWGQTILRLYLFSEYQFLLLTNLKNSEDVQIAAIAEKSLKETTYHLRWSKEWVIRLGDGTLESNEKMHQAIENLWRYTRELFEPVGYELVASENKIGTDIRLLKEEWLQKVNATFAEATLPIDLVIATGWSGLQGKQGIHTEYLGFILTELQYLQRTYPNSEW